ncbi:MAG TPA: DUF523 domain-containing protein [Halanaerobiales bacterium]|nr:DUF523 domain-containing protein [Halanaerobiales bacterium]
MILVSACLMGKNCRYNGGNSLNPELLELLKGREIKMVCPEKAGGLCIPRSPSEIIGGNGLNVIEGTARVISRNGEDLSREFIEGARESISGIKLEDLEMAILKSRSPSCGNRFIYDGSFLGKAREGPGVFSALLLKKEIPIFSEEELDKIKEMLA